MGQLTLVLLVTLVAAITAVDEQCCEGQEKTIQQLTRQLMLQQLFVEERIRSDGASGLKQSRMIKDGTMPYHRTTMTGALVASIHEHANHERVVGMGEFVAVLNGVEFRTRHNDYQVVKSAGGSGKIQYDATEEITYPDVPPEVTRLTDVDKQIEEMREWFKAWRDQDTSQRDYRKYFKPILCYLEGGWTVSDEDNIDESFNSDRHFLDAKSWHDLQEKVRFTSYSGRKDSLENFAYLPTTVMSAINGTTNLAQWNYRILCHPLSRDLSTKRFKTVDDITSRMAYGRTLKQHEASRAARFRLAPEDKDEWREKITRWTLLDDLMAEVPGKDGYGNELTDPGLDGKIATNLVGGGPLKSGYYHRWFKTEKDAMGSQTQHRAYADENAFMASNTQDKIASMSLEKCRGRGKRKACSTVTQRWTYAIPLEIIYMNPLYNWNPYNIAYKGTSKSEAGKTVLADGRNGRSKEKALDGNNNKYYYRTPLSFFKSLESSGDPADTAGKALWALDGQGTPRQVVASGTRISLPEIEDVGTLRTRFPIMPFHYEGSAEWKELTALKNLILQPKLYSHIFYEGETDNKEPTTIVLKMRTSRKAGVDQHDHYVYVDSEDLKNLVEKRGSTLDVETSIAVGHSHSLRLKANKNGRVFYSWCGSQRMCGDGHPVTLDQVDE